MSSSNEIEIPGYRRASNRQEAAPQRLWNWFHNEIFEIPKNRPGVVMAMLYGMSSAAFLWGSHCQGKVTRPNFFKDVITAELTNVGILSALLLTFAISPIQGSSAAANITSNVLDVYYSLWMISSIFLSFGVLMCAVGLTHLAAFDNEHEMSGLHNQVGIFLHIPLHFLLIGGIAALLGLTVQLYYLVSAPAFYLMLGLIVFVFSLTTYIFTCYVRGAWDAFHDQQIVTATTESDRKLAVVDNALR